MEPVLLMNILEWYIQWQVLNKKTICEHICMCDNNRMSLEKALVLREIIKIFKTKCLKQQHADKHRYKQLTYKV